MPTEPAPRPHTGRRRNEAARTAILAAAADLLGSADPATVTIDTIAAEAGVGKQTIYRWWPSKGAVLLDAMIERASRAAPTPDTGTLLGDLTTFLTATFLGAGTDPAAALLRTAMAEAQRDRHAAEVLGEFTAGRRVALHEILARAGNRGELRPDTDTELVVDQAYGLLWYRILLGNAPLTRAVAADLAAGLVRQCGQG